MIALLWLLAAANIIIGLATGDDTNIVIGNIWAATILIIRRIER
jgi:hypothetical protein